MPDLTTFGHDPIPTGTEGSYVPGDFMAFAESIDPKLTHAAVSLVDRDTNFGGISNGHFVTCPSLMTVWMKVSGGWLTVYSDSGWQTISPGAFAGAWTGGASSKYRQLGSTVDLYLQATYNGSTVTGGISGDITNIPLITLPTAILPVLRVVGAFVASTPGFYTILTSAGSTAYISHILPGASLVNGTVLYLHDSYTI